MPGTVPEWMAGTACAPDWPLTARESWMAASGDGCRDCLAVGVRAVGCDRNEALVHGTPACWHLGRSQSSP